MIEAISAILVFIIFSGIVFIVLKRKPSDKDINDYNQSAKPLFAFILRLLGIFLFPLSVFALLGGPDGKFGSKESIVIGSVWLLISVALLLVARSISKSRLTK